LAYNVLQNPGRDDASDSLVLVDRTPLRSHEDGTALGGIKVEKRKENGYATFDGGRCRHV
jgi:hypothetical protein